MNSATYPITLARMWPLIRFRMVSPRSWTHAERTSRRLSNAYRGALYANRCSEALAGQNARLEPRGRLRRLHAELLDQRPTALQVLAQGVTCASGPGVGDHQGAVRALVQLGDVRQLAGEVRGARVVTQPLMNLDQPGQHRDVAVDQTLAIGGRPIGVALLRQRFASPEQAGPLQQDPAPIAFLGACGLGRRAELLGIDRPSLGVQAVGMTLALDRASLDAGQVQDTTRARHCHVQAATGARDGSARPERLEDQVLGDELAVVNEQEADETRVHRAAPAPWTDLPTITRDAKPTEHREPKRRRRATQALTR